MPTQWTPERRAQQAEHARKVKPWLYSTGPRTPEGKAICARNPYKGGHWRTLRKLRLMVSAELRASRDLLRYVKE